MASGADTIGAACLVGVFCAPTMPQAVMAVIFLIWVITVSDKPKGKKDSDDASR